MVNEAGAGLAVGPDEIARGARELASSSSEQRAEWGRNGRAFVERHHSRSAIAERLESLLDDLAPPPR